MAVSDEITKDPKTLRVCGEHVGHRRVCRFLNGHEGPHEVRVSCDGPEQKDCCEEVVFYCACARCDSEPKAKEAFFSCAIHRREADARHRHIRGMSARWFDGNERDREEFIRA